MKRFTLFAIAAISLVLTSCSKDQISSEKGNGNRTFSMTLNASVNETKATMSDAWKFAFSTGDKISLTNNQVTAGTYYELTRGSDGNFTGDVTAPTSAADWYAYYPSSSVSLANQTGTKTGTAAYCALAGKQENVAADSKNLNISLSFQTSILVVDAQKGNIDINVKTSDGQYVSGFEAKANAASFDVTKSVTKVSLLTATATGTYYVVVPAGVKIAIYDGNTKIKETNEAGLTAGKYYNIIVPIKNVGDVLSTVEGGFPNSSKQYTPPINAWTNGGNVFAYTYSVALFFNTAYVTLATQVKKVGDSYTSSASSGTVNIIFNMTDGILTSIEYKRVSAANTNSDGIFYAKPLPVELTMTPEITDNKYKVTINIKGTDILSCSYCFVDMDKYNDGTYKKEMIDLTDQQLSAVKSSEGCPVCVDNCTIGKGYKIVLAVSTSTVSSKTIVAGYYLDN